MYYFDECFTGTKYFVSQSQYETCIAPLTKLNSGAEQNKTLKHTIKIKK